MFRTASPPAVLERLSAIPHLGDAPPRELDVLAKVSTAATVSPGRVLCAEGGPPLEAFLVVDGEAEVLVGGRSVARVGPGGFLGEMALVEHAERSATVVAATPMTVLTMNPAELATLLSDAPTLARLMMADMAHRLRDADRRLPARSA